MSVLKVGDRVVVLHEAYSIKGKMPSGVIVYILAEKVRPQFAVEMEPDYDKSSLCHDCGGNVKSGRGLWFDAHQLSICAGSIELTDCTITAPKEKKTAKDAFFDKDWVLINTILENEKIRRILLYGPPGCSKTMASFLAAIKCCGENAKVFMTSAHEESMAEELTGHWIPKGMEFLFHKGHGTNAMNNGWLIVNEPDRASGAFRSILHAFLDDPEVARIHLPNGEIVRPHGQYKVIVP